MKHVILITGASSGFGALAARAPARAGHTVYATMRETAGRNAAQVETARRFAADNRVDLRTAELDVHVDPAEDGAEVVNGVADRVRAELLRRIGLGDLLAPAVPA